MKSTIGSVAVANAATGVVFLGPFDPLDWLESVSIWFDRQELPAAGANMTVEIGLFSSDAGAAGFSAGGLFVSTLPVVVGVSAAPNPLRVSEYVSIDRRFVGVRFVNGTGFAFAMGVSVNISDRGFRRLPGRGVGSGVGLGGGLVPAAEKG